jgi:hypothetical protein
MIQRTHGIRLLALAWLALGCDARGVSLGTEELCVLDRRIEVAQAHSPGEDVSTCAKIGDNRLVNASFEVPLVDTCKGDFCSFPVADVPGWQTSSADQVIEIWQDQYRGVPSAAGNQFAELDANSPDTLWQDIELPPGQLMYWSLLHHGRDGIETLEVLIGPPDAPASQGTFSADVTAWQPHSGLYRVAEQGEPVTHFALASRTGLADGNLVDSVVFAPVN